eukprot:735267-Rhodomonas_salina.1
MCIRDRERMGWSEFPLGESQGAQQQPYGGRGEGAQQQYQFGGRGDGDGDMLSGPGGYGLAGDGVGSTRD